MFRIKTVSDDEIDYFDEIKSEDSGLTMLDFISQVENISEKNQTVYEVKKDHKVTANIATQPKRFERLLLTLKSIEGQFDEVRIYLNNFKYVPEELSKYTTYIGQDLTDNGKFFWSENDNEYYFSLDDDIIYPSDYVEKTLPLIGNRIISYHGRILTGKNKPYYSNHKMYMYHGYLPKDRRLDVVGTGVMAFDTNVFKPTIWKSANYRMTDLIISLEAHIHGIKLLCPKKNKNWITYEEFSFDGICNHFTNSEEKLTAYCDMIQTLINSNVDLLVVNYKYTNESIQKLSDFIKNKNQQNLTFINLRTGDGSLIESISKVTDFNSYSSYDTDNKRIDKCNSHYIKGKVLYKSLSEYTELALEGKNCFILLDDLILPKVTSTNIYNKSKNGSHLICKNFVNNVLPDDKIKMYLEDGTEVDFFYYFKK